MRPFVPEHRDDGLMIILPARDVDAGCLARFRVATVRRDQQRCRQLAPILKRDHHFMVTAIDARDARFPKQPHVLPRVRARMERCPQVAVLMHEAERLAIVGIEVQPAGLQTVGNRDAPDRAAGLG